jgi:methyltransferase
MHVGPAIVRREASSNRVVKTIPRWYLAVLAAVALEKLRELRISGVNEAASHSRVHAAPQSYPLMVAAHVGLVTLPAVEVAGRDDRRPRWRWALVLGAATALRLWSIRSLGEAWNVRGAVPWRLRPVTSGPYAYIRHPNYLAVILEFAAVPMLAGARLSALLLSTLNAIVLFDRIRAEERLLNASRSYRRHFANRARFIPRVF